MKAKNLAFAVILFVQPTFAEITASDVAVVIDKDGALADMTTQAMPNVWLAKVACMFYEQYPDQYDAIFVFTTIPMSFMTNVQQGWPVKQTTKGIGRPLSNMSANFCSKKGRLRQAVKMGYLAVLPDDPDAIYTGIPMYALSGIELMAHEFGHHWLASITFKKEDGVEHCYVRGYEPMGEMQGEMCDGGYKNGFNQHWSYYYNSRSVMYGSFIEDLGDGNFKLWYDNPKFSELDQYLMGLRLPEEVPPQFLVDTGDLTGSASLPPRFRGKYIYIKGTRVDFTVEDVIRSVGPRIPALEECHWKGALILAVPVGKPPTNQEINKVIRYGQRFEEFYAWATDGRGSFDFTLDGRGKGTLTCPAPSEPGGPGNPEPLQDISRTDDLQAFEPYDPGPPPETVFLDVSGVSETHETSSLMCTPGEKMCHPLQETVVRCNQAGNGFETLEDCRSKGHVCENGTCVSRSGSSSGKGGGCASLGQHALWPLALFFLLIPLLRRRN